MQKMWIVIAVVFAGLMSFLPQAAAKMPAFELEVVEAPDGPTDDLIVRVVVDESFSDFDARDLNGLLAAFPASSLTEDLRPRQVTQPHHAAVDIPLRSVGQGIYEGSARLGDEGEGWVIVPFPYVTSSSAELSDVGYPDPVRLADGVGDAPKTRSIVLATLAVSLIAGAIIDARRGGRLGKQIKLGVIGRR